MSPSEVNQEPSQRSLRQIKRSPPALATEVYNGIVDALLEGQLGPGDRLIQDRLADELDVSRTPVRDALLRLREEGVIEASGRRGYVVRTLGREEIEHLYEARCAIEGHAAAILAAVDKERLEPVREALNAAVQKPMTTSRESFEANRAVHRAIVAAVKNPHLLGFFDAIWGRALGGWAYHEFFAAAPYATFLEDHERLLEQLATGDPERARQAMVEHILEGLAVSTTKVD